MAADEAEGQGDGGKVMVYEAWAFVAIALLVLLLSVIGVVAPFLLELRTLLVLLGLWVSVVLLAVRLFLVLPYRVTGIGEPASAVPLPSVAAGGGTCSVLVVMGSGGHTTEMLRLMEPLSPNYSPRTYVVADTDKHSGTKVEAFEHRRQKALDYAIVTFPRSREVKQSMLSSIFTTARATLAAFPIMARAMPDLVLTNGPGTCVPLCFVAYLFRFFGVKQIRIVYIESVCRVKSLSLTAKVLYLFADALLVQWEPVHKLYPNTEFVGRLY